MVGLAPGRTVRGALLALRRGAARLVRPFDPRRGACFAFGNPPIRTENLR